ncbi:hypothetical protein [Methylogaea oryzae]|uniref:hypothetical protein n=1 Tax=Methylogaea oryzae TaxID=1295382 RepID=UPI0006D02FE7|nr:hypothetical protein [Methylogaea oryzae]
MHFCGEDDNNDPDTVALIDEIRLTNFHQGDDGTQMPKSVSIRIINETTDLFIANLYKALSASYKNCEITFNADTRRILISPLAGTITHTVMVRLFGVLYKMQAIIFNDVVIASDKLGVTPPPRSLDTVKRDLAKIWTNPKALAMENYTFQAPYFKFNPNVRLARGPLLVNTVELNLERGTRQCPYVTLHVSHRATEIFISTLQTTLEKKVGGRLTYNPSIRCLTVMPPGDNVSKQQLGKILEALYESKAIAYNDQIDACEGLKLNAPPEDPLKSKEKRDLTELYKPPHGGR